MNTLNQAKQLQDRTKKFAVRIIKAFARLPKTEATRIIGRQFLRSGTSLLITEPLVERGPQPTSFPKSAL
jgi:hypothetical protein